MTAEQPQSEGTKEFPSGNDAHVAERSLQTLSAARLAASTKWARPAPQARLPVPGPLSE
jgi:hypothetical protein